MADKRTKKKAKDNIAGYLFILPLILYFVVFQLAPMFMALGISFTEWNMRSDAVFVGFRNYAELLTNTKMYPYFYKSFWVTLQYMLMTIPLSLVLTTVVAAFLNGGLKGERFFKTAFYIPSVTVGVAVSAMWMFMLDPTYGFINQIMGTHVNFLGDKALALPTLAIMSVWGGLGYNVLIMLSAMKNIDRSLYEAAEMDGANVFVQFLHVTVPSVMPTIFFLLITSMIGSFQAFDQMYLMTGGGPEHSTYTYMLGIYKQAYEYDNMGVASAMSYLLFIVILIITFIQFKVVPQGTGEEGGDKRGKRASRKAAKTQA